MCINDVQRGVISDFRYMVKIVGHGGQEWLYIASLLAYD